MKSINDLLTMLTYVISTVLHMKELSALWMDGKNGICFLCRSLNLGFSASVKFRRCGFLTLIFLCDQGERGAAGLDGRSGLDGKPGVPGPPGQRVGDSCHFYLNMNGCYMCVTNTVFWLLWYRGILGKQVILGEM